MTALLAAGGTVLVLDQWTKRMVEGHVTGRGLSVGTALRIRRVTTVRASFTRARGRMMLAATWLVACACAVALSLSGTGFEGEAAWWGVGAALGGAAGNLLDVLRRQSVRDFIDLGWWPVFNLADVGIVGGLVLAFWPQV